MARRSASTLLCLALLCLAAVAAEEGEGAKRGRSSDEELAGEELADGRYGSRREGMYKWQRNKEKVKDKALEAKARRLGISVDEARELDEQRVLADDPRKDAAAGSGVESDYGKRSGQYTWQRNKEEVKRKAEQAKEKMLSGGEGPGSGAAAASEAPEPTFDAADLSGAVSVPVLLLKFDEPRSWYQEPRLCPPDTSNNADCEKPAKGMRVKALEPSDLKEKKRARLLEEDPESYGWMEEMNGLGGVIVKLTNGKNNALVKFDVPEVEEAESEEVGQQVRFYLTFLSSKKKTNPTFQSLPSSLLANRSSSFSVDVSFPIAVAV